MQEQDGLNPADRELEMALKSLTPAPTGIDAIAAAYSAGRRAAQHQLNLWRSAAAAMLLIGAGIWIIPNGRDATTGPLAIDQQLATNDAVAKHSPAPSSLVVLRHAFRERGIEGLPTTNLPAVQKIRSDELF